jgi:hypothetical protein
MSVQDTNAPDPPPNPEASYTQEDVDEILGEKKPISLDEIPF